MLASEGTDQAPPGSAVNVVYPGPSVGDMQIWGPNALSDEADADSGARTQGTCIALQDGQGCMVSETIVFADGSTLLLCRVEDRRGHSHLCAARSVNGLDGWQIDSSPTFMADP